jgi:hypothetical protein
VRSLTTRPATKAGTAAQRAAVRGAQLVRSFGDPLLPGVASSSVSPYASAIRGQSAAYVQCPAPVPRIGPTVDITQSRATLESTVT